jgi:ribosomal protein L17
MPPKMSKEDREWQAKADARTLAEAEVIKTTPGRAKMAKKAAQQMATEADKEARAMKKVAKNATKKNTPGNAGRAAPRKARGGGGRARGGARARRK